METRGTHVVTTEIAALGELVALLGVSRQQANTLTSRVGFPPPCAYLSCGRVWEVADVVIWATGMKRKVYVDAYDQLIAENRRRVDARY